MTTRIKIITGSENRNRKKRPRNDDFLLRDFCRVVDRVVDFFFVRFFAAMMNYTSIIVVRIMGRRFVC